MQCVHLIAFAYVIKVYYMYGPGCIMDYTIKPPMHVFLNLAEQEPG